MSSSSNCILDRWSLEPNPTNGGTDVIDKSTDERYVQKRRTTPIDGVPHPSFIRQDVLDAQRSQLSLRPTDVCVTTYSKCGTTLSEQIVCLLLNGGRLDESNPLDKNAYSKEKSSLVGKIWVEMAVVDGLEGVDVPATMGPVGPGGEPLGEARSRMSVRDFDAIPSPRVLKSHEPPRLYLDRDGRSARVLYVTRNPFDACVSCYYHPKRGMSPHSLGMPFEGFVKFWLSDACEFGGWIEHTKGWRKEYCRRNHREENGDDGGGGDGNDNTNYNMLWIAYEDLVRDSMNSIEKIAAFIGVDTRADPTLVGRVAEGCKFDNVKRRAQASLDGGARGDIDHLRKGEVGDWRNHFGEELFEEFEREIRRRFADDGVGMGMEYDIGGGETWSPKG